MSTVQKPRIKRNIKNKTNTNNSKPVKSSGWYVFRNHKNCELTLPKATSKGVKCIPYNETWEGDVYYFSLVRSRLAQFVREIPIEELNSNNTIISENTVDILEKAEKNAHETLSNLDKFLENEQKKENNIMSEKLILDQAPCVTTDGSVEQYVVNPDETTLNPEDLGIVMLDNVKTTKNKKNKVHEQKDELLNNPHITGIQILN